MKDKAIKKSLKHLMGSDEIKTVDINNMYNEDKEELASIFKRAKVEDFHDGVKFVAKIFGNMFGCSLLATLGDAIISNNKTSKIQEARTPFITTDERSERFAEIEKQHNKSMTYFSSGVIGLDICLNVLTLNDRIKSINNNIAKQRDEVRSIIEKYKVE
jgi:hypothetical protein